MVYPSPGFTAALLKASSSRKDPRRTALPIQGITYRETKEPEQNPIQPTSDCLSVARSTSILSLSAKASHHFRPDDNGSLILPQGRKLKVITNRNKLHHLTWEAQALSWGWWVASDMFKKNLANIAS